jgi:hypothetical protein
MQNNDINQPNLAIIKYSWFQESYYHGITNSALYYQMF